MWLIWCVFPRACVISGVLTIYLIPPWSRVVTCKIIFILLDWQFHILLTGRFFAIFTTICYWFLPWDGINQSASLRRIWHLYMYKFKAENIQYISLIYTYVFCSVWTIPLLTYRHSVCVESVLVSVLVCFRFRFTAGGLTVSVYDAILISMQSPLPDTLSS